MKIRLIFCAIIPFILASCNSPRGNIEKIGNLTVVHLYGSPYQRGYDYGLLLKDDIREITERWKKDLEETYNQDFNLVVKNFFRSTSFIDTIKTYIPELLEEIKGISEGSGIDYQTILAFQVSEEIDVLAGDMKGRNCTSLSINKTDTTATFLAQNMDPSQLFHGTPTLLHITDRNRRDEKFIFTFPGLIGLCGMNSNGIGITCDGISMLNHSRSGLPVAFIVRSILDQKEEESAFDLIERVPVGIPQCFTIGGRKTARCYECSANDKKIFYPFKKKNITLHTNFSIANRDFSQKFIDLLKKYGKTVNDPYYCPRYFISYDNIVEFNYDLNYQNIRAILSSTESDIRAVSNEDTFGSLIMELSEEPTLYIAPGRPHETEYIKLRF